jgi:hypothetical protein
VYNALYAIQTEPFLGKIHDGEWLQGHNLNMKDNNGKYLGKKYGLPFDKILSIPITI